jgi:hypothetical protein
MRYEDNSNNRYRLICRWALLLLGLLLPLLTYNFEFSYPLLWYSLAVVLILSFVKGKLVGGICASLGLLVLLIQILDPLFLSSQFSIRINGYILAILLIATGYLFYWMSIRTLPLNILTIRVSGPGQINTRYLSQGRTRISIRHGLRSAFKENTIEILPGRVRQTGRRRSW